MRLTRAEVRYVRGLLEALIYRGELAHPEIARRVADKLRWRVAARVGARA